MVGVDRRVINYKEDAVNIAYSNLAIFISSLSPLKWDREIIIVTCISSEMLPQQFFFTESNFANSPQLEIEVVYDIFPAKMDDR